MARLIDKTEEEVWDANFGDLVITEPTGFFYTNEEWEQKRKRVLDTPLI